MKIADISKWQGNVDWAAAAKELSFCILRASCGESVDTKFYDNVKGCVENGIPFGVYHYVKAGTATAAVKEAQFFLKTCAEAQRQPNFWIADIEYEAQTAQTTEAVCVAFLHTLRASDCQKIGLYINTRYAWAGAAIGLCDIMWIPHWGKNDGDVPADRYKPKHPYDLWQYTSRGRLAGVKGDVDLNQISDRRTLEWFTGQKEEDMNETNRATIPFTNDHFMTFMRKMVGAPYWFGTCMYKCTESLRARKANQYPSHYGSSRTSRYRQDIAAKKVCADCIGAAKGYAWTGGGSGVLEAIGTDAKITSKYGSNGCPDKGADSMFAYAKSKGMDWGAIDTMPEIIGLAVRHSGHVGYYDGDGYVIEFKGFKYGCVRTKLSAGKWTHWYELPFIDYDGAAGGMPEPDDPPAEYSLGSRTLKRGSEGGDVKELQEILAALGYDLGNYGEDGDGADGKYGEKTEKAVRKFQSIQQIEADGKYGSITHKALMGVLAEKDNEFEDEERPPVGKHVCATGDSVNVRTGPSTAYTIITRVNKGDTMPYVATAEVSGWHAVEVCGKIGWISGKYAEVKE